MQQAGRLAETGILVVRNADGTPKAFADGYHFYGHGDMEFNNDVFYYYTGTAGGQIHCPASRSAPPPGEWNMDTGASHETVHWSGVDHNTQPGTQMYSSLNQGVPWIPLNSEEVATMIRTYGQRP